jgi:hypothetical protein
MFWYLVPHGLVDVIGPEVPEWAGLLRGPKEDEVQQVYSVIKAPKNEAATPLTDREQAKLLHCLSNQIYSFARQIRRQDNLAIWENWTSEYEI